MTPAQCRAARALIGMSLNELAGNAVVPQGVIMAYEAGTVTPRPADLKAIQRALERTGVELIHLSGQSGVRLRK
jgi:predicted transcriptional regulator